MQKAITRISVEYQFLSVEKCKLSYGESLIDRFHAMNYEYVKYVTTFMELR